MIKQLWSIVVCAALGGGVAFASESGSEQPLVESDTGIVFGDLDCEIHAHTAGSPTLGMGVFHELTATINVDYTCTTLDGLEWKGQGQDTMVFPTVTFDRRLQAWKIGSTVVAHLRTGRTVELATGLDLTTWSHGDSTHVALRAVVYPKPGL